MKRHEFINASAALLALLDVHEVFANAGSATSCLSAATITELQLLTVTPLSELRRFYERELNLPILSENGKELVVQAGETHLIFVKYETTGPSPFYHVAFNIPENKIIQAYEWQKRTTEVLPTPAHMIDPAYPADIRHFKNWNAHSVFFWDPSGNLLEYIARHDLKNSASGEFSGKDILCASEIAFIVEDVNKIAETFQDSLGIGEYKQGSDNFRAMGDEHGLLLIMKKGRVWMENSETPKIPGVFKTSARIRSATSSLKMTEYPYQIIASA